MLIIGIDDAGRGPVIGPMILAGILSNKENEKLLKEYGVRDSKLLLPSKRKLISEKIKKSFKSFSIAASSKEIDNHKNLNWLEAEKAAKIIEELTQNVHEKVKITIDCPSINCQAWQDYLVQKIPKKTRGKILSISSEHKADLNHPIVSAASIIAKEKREDEIKKLKKALNIDFGSGYPSDPKTKEFIKENFRNPEYENIIRFSWNTVKRLVKEKKQKGLGEF